jgi:hypothetical protein
VKEPTQMTQCINNHSAVLSRSLDGLQTISYHAPFLSSSFESLRLNPESTMFGALIFSRWAARNMMAYLSNLSINTSYDRNQATSYFRLIFTFEATNFRVVMLVIYRHNQCSEAAWPAADRTSDLQSGQIKSLILEAAQSLGR